MTGLVMSKLDAGDRVQINVSFLEPLQIFNQMYQFKLPMSFGPGIIPQEAHVDQYVNINCSINCVIPGMQVSRVVATDFNDFPFVPITVPPPVQLLLRLGDSLVRLKPDLKFK